MSQVARLRNGREKPMPDLATINPEAGDHAIPEDPLRFGSVWISTIDELAASLGPPGRAPC
jgi:hypothetical protein